MYDVFLQDTISRATRYGHKFRWDHTVIGEHPGVQYASVTHISDTGISLHSTAAIYRAPIIETGFVQTLKSFENQSLWKNLIYDGDGEWIYRGLLQGSLCIVCDGSYQEHISTEISSAGVQIYCTNTKQWAKCSVVEYSEAASNY